jgi:hemolysin III
LDGRERFNIVSHFVGVLLAAAALLVLVVPAVRDGEFTKAIGFTVYGSSLIVMFLVSTLYHSFQGELRDLLRRCDRIAIYVLMAGTYTPLALRLPPHWMFPLLIVPWGLALYGSILEWRAARTKEPHSVSLYIVMGWMSVLALRPLIVTFSVAGVAYLVAGGVIYTIGAAIVRMSTHRLKHEIWHVAVLAGAACHFLVMLLYVD